MIKRILFTLLFAIIGFSSFSQKGHRIAFIDMNYILENIPDYKKAQNQLNTKVQKWQQNLDGIKAEIETMKTDLSNEKALLTDDLIAEKEEDIAIKEEEFKKLENQYFSSNGNLFLLRKQLVTPIQDQVYNAAQEIAKARRYDFVFDKSSDLIMLYSTKQNDISELVLRTIVRSEKTAKANEKRVSRATTSKRKATPVVTNTPTTIQKKNTPITEVNSNTVTPLVSSTEEEVSSTEEIVTTDSSKKNTEVIESTVQKDENTAIETIEVTEPLTAEESKQAKLDERELKRQEALAKNEKLKADRLKKREEQKAAIEKKRLERLKKREEVRSQLKENKEIPEKEKEDDNKDNNN